VTRQVWAGIQIVFANPILIDFLKSGHTSCLSSLAGYRHPARAGSEESKKALAAIDKVLDEITREAAP